MLCRYESLFVKFLGQLHELWQSDWIEHVQSTIRAVSPIKLLHRHGAVQLFNAISLKPDCSMERINCFRVESKGNSGRNFVIVQLVSKYIYLTHFFTQPFPVCKLEKKLQNIKSNTTSYSCPCIWAYVSKQVKEFLSLKLDTNDTVTISSSGTRSNCKSLCNTGVSICKTTFSFNSFEASLIRHFNALNKCARSFSKIIFFKHAR